jgi:hypothetical protein
MGARRNRRSEASDLCGAFDLYCGTFRSPRRPDGSSRAARHTYPRRSSIEPTTILLRKQKYRLIGIGPFMSEP